MLLQGDLADFNAFKYKFQKVDLEHFVWIISNHNLSPKGVDSMDLNIKIRPDGIIATETDQKATFFRNTFIPAPFIPKAASDLSCAVR